MGKNEKPDQFLIEWSNQSKVSVKKRTISHGFFSFNLKSRPWAWPAEPSEGLRAYSHQTICTVPPKV